MRNSTLQSRERYIHIAWFSMSGGGGKHNCRTGWSELPFGLPETVCFKLFCHGWIFQHGVISFFGLGWGYFADDRLPKWALFEPIYPFQRCELHGLEVSYGPRVWMTSAL